MPVARILSLPKASFVATLKMPRIPVPSCFSNLHYSKNGKWLAATSESRYCSVIVWESATRRQHMHLAETDQAVAISRDETRLAVGASDKTIHLYDLEMRDLLWRVAGHETTITGLAFSPDGRLLVSTAKSGPMKVWDVHRGEEILDLANEHSRYDFPTFSADGQTLVVGATNATDGVSEILLLKTNR
jgi:WD40 repeat protein